MYLAILLSLLISGSICYSAYNPDAAINPVCLRPPPIPFLIDLALLIASDELTKTEPIGQHNPLVRQKIMESKHLPIYFGSH